MRFERLDPVPDCFDIVRQHDQQITRAGLAQARIDSINFTWRCLDPVRTATGVFGTVPQHSRHRSGYAAAQVVILAQDDVVEQGRAKFTHLQDVDIPPVASHTKQADDLPIAGRIASNTAPSEFSPSGLCA